MRLPFTISRNTGLWIVIGLCRLAGFIAEVGEAIARDRLDNPPTDKPENPGEDKDND